MAFILYKLIVLLYLLVTTTCMLPTLKIPLLEEDELSEPKADLRWWSRADNRDDERRSLLHMDTPHFVDLEQLELLDDAVSKAAGAPSAIPTASEARSIPNKPDLKSVTLSAIPLASKFPANEFVQRIKNISYRGETDPDGFYDGKGTLRIIFKDLYSKEITGEWIKGKIFYGEIKMFNKNVLMWDYVGGLKRIPESHEYIRDGVGHHRTRHYKHQISYTGVLDYIGTWRNDRKNGFGYLTNRAQQKFTGVFFNDMIYKGSFTQPQTHPYYIISFEGEWYVNSVEKKLTPLMQSTRDFLRFKKGIIKYINGDRFVGEIEENTGKKIGEYVYKSLHSPSIVQNPFSEVRCKQFLDENRECHYCVFGLWIVNDKKDSFYCHKGTVKKTRVKTPKHYNYFDY